MTTNEVVYKLKKAAIDGIRTLPGLQTYFNSKRDANMVRQIKLKPVSTMDILNEIIKA